MVVTQIGLSGDALLLSPSGTRPGYIIIGIGSKTESTFVTAMGSEWARAAFTSTDISVAKSITWSTDFGSTIMSGCALREWCMNTGSPGMEPWHYVNFGVPVTFDGTNELRVDLTWTKAGSG